MFEEYRVQKRIRRFKKDITVLIKDNVTVKIIEGEKYKEVYEKIWCVLKDINSSEKVTVEVSFISDEYVSMLYKTESKCIGLNYSLESGYFEREAVVLRYAGITKNRIAKALKNNSIKSVNLFSRVFLFSGGVGVIFDNRGDKVVKIRL